MAEKKFGPFNLNSIGEENFTALMSQICEFLNNIGECKVLYIGAAGISNSRLKELIEFAGLGATLCDVIGDLYDKQPDEVAKGETAIKKQMKLTLMELQ